MNDNEQVTLSEEQTEQVRSLYRIRRTVSGLEKSKKAIRSGLLDDMAAADATTAVFPDGSSAFTLKTRTTRRVDVDRMLKEHPGLAKYVTEKESVVLDLF